MSGSDVLTCGDGDLDESEIADTTPAVSVCNAIIQLVEFAILDSRYKRK